MIRTALALALAATLLAGCTSSKTARTSEPPRDTMAERALGGPSAASARTGEVTTINTVCPIGGHEFAAAGHSPELVRTHKGAAIGFCCDGCTGAWDAMTDAQRDEVLAIAKANKAPAAH